MKNVFTKVYLPLRVYDEIVIEENIKLDKKFFIKKEIKDREFYSILLKSLDSGECEAIILAQEMNLSLIIDEKKGRKIAQNLGINIFGFIGLLILNYKNSFLSQKEVIDIFYQAKKEGFRVGKNLEDNFLNMVS